MNFDIKIEMVSGQVPVISRDELPTGEEWISYTLFIRIVEAVKIRVGRLGVFKFPAGEYVYSGSAVKSICARVNRHLRADKKLHWHIDYLLAAPEVKITRVSFSTLAECRLVAASGGGIVVPGFGASDCLNGCSSHLRRIK